MSPHPTSPRQTRLLMCGVALVFAAGFAGLECGVRSPLVEVAAFAGCCCMLAAVFDEMYGGD